MFFLRAKVYKLFLYKDFSVKTLRNNLFTIEKKYKINKLLIFNNDIVF